MRTRLENRTESQKENRTAPNSRVNYCYLSTAEKCQRISRLHTSLRYANHCITRLKNRLEEATVAAGEVLDDQTHSGLREIMIEHSPNIQDQFPQDSFGRIFWEQQMEALKLKRASSIRWHSLIIKWCLHLRHLSSSSYEALRKTGVLKLPSQRTLRDYTHHTEAKPGFSVDVDLQLISAAQISTCEDRMKCIVLFMDEMYIREDLVYEKASGM